jgi:hypothetical protein
MKKALIILAFCIPVFSLAEEKKENYESGKLKYACNYKNGKIEGLEKIYYESGALSEEANYKNGKQEGSPTEGASYDFVDDGVKNRKTYSHKLEDVDLDGISTFHGPVKATPREIYGIMK